jgi:hypothetical protein
MLDSKANGGEGGGSMVTSRGVRGQGCFASHGCAFADHTWQSQLADSFVVKSCFLPDLKLCLQALGLAVDTVDFFLSQNVL